MTTSEEALKRAEARLGSVLREKWRLDELLGMGGMAAVYAATHRNGKRAAIKVLDPLVAVSAQMRARFQQEGYLANRVGHPGAVSILDDDLDDDGTVFLVMELLEGETLEQRWAHHHRIAWPEVCLIADQVLDVLDAAHSKGIVHRDLKPGNIFIEHGGTIKVLDFGIARLGARGLEVGVTGNDTALGTPGFMPPEQARGHNADVDAQSDLFALGATLFAILSGQYLHEAETANEQFMLAMTSAAAPLSDVAPQVPARIAEVVDKAVRFDKAERYLTALDMQSAIREAYEAEAGKPLERANRLSVPLFRSRTTSARPDAPTLALDHSAGATNESERGTTTRPVTEEPDEAKDSASGGGRRRLLIGMAALGCILVIVGLAQLRGPSSTTAAASAPSPQGKAQAAAPGADTGASSLLNSSPGVDADGNSEGDRDQAGPEPGPVASKPAAGSPASAAPPALLARGKPRTAPARPSALPASSAEKISTKPDASGAPVDIFSKRK